MKGRGEEGGGKEEERGRETRLLKFRPGRAASLSTATAPVCPQRCGSSGVSASPL